MNARNCFARPAVANHAGETLSALVERDELRTGVVINLDFRQHVLLP